MGLIARNGNTNVLLGRYERPNVVSVLSLEYPHNIYRKSFVSSRLDMHTALQRLAEQIE